MAQRIWDRFLTEQDRALQAAQPAKRYGFGERPALLLVDIYRWVLGDKPEPLLEAIRTWPASCGLAGWDSLPHIKRLLDASREAGIPVVFVTGLYPEDSGVAAWPARGTERQNLRQQGTRERLETRYEVPEEIKPAPGEAFLRKTGPSAFFGTPLLAHLNSLNVDTLITCGESTSGCVRASVVDGRSYSFRMTVVEECVFDRTEASHAMNLFDMDQKYADVLPLSQVLDYLQGIKKQGGGNRKQQTVTAPVPT